VTGVKLHFSESDLLDWAVAETIDSDRLRERLRAGETLNVKLGIDPTSPDVHLGRSIPLWRLRAFQELGHQIHFIVGNFTAQIGDTSDKESERPMLSVQQVAANVAHYMEQVWMILDPGVQENVHVHYNADWLGTMTLAELGELADAFSVNTFIKRELIAKRLELGARVSLREMLYPLMQGYDSLVVAADVELGGTDQRFNLLAGRTLQERRGLPPQALIMNPLVAGTDGRKMSSSWGNVISLRDEPDTMFGKVMSIPDTLLVEYLHFLPLSAQPFGKAKLTERIKDGENPRDLKAAIASALVELYHGPEKAQEAQKSFDGQFTERQPSKEVLVPGACFPLSLLDIADGYAGWEGSRSELRRVFAAGGVEVDGVKILDPEMTVVTSAVPFVLKVGKRILLRVVS
jgi:tyrosyl-tRNA synthetase